MRSKLNKSEHGHSSAASAVRFNGNKAINNFKSSIPSLKIEKTQDQDQDFLDYDCQEIELNEESHSS